MSTFFQDKVLHEDIAIWRLRDLSIEMLKKAKSYLHNGENNNIGISFIQILSHWVLLTKFLTRQ